MEKIKNYKFIVTTLVKEIASWVNDEPIETQSILDQENGHYLLFSVGWYENNQREYAPFLHIDVKENGKVYLQHDGTDLKIALMLVERGIQKTDIVLAFHAPQRRQFVEGFAMA
jgi:hypothetical protein